MAIQFRVDGDMEAAQPPEGVPSGGSGPPGHTPGTAPGPCEIRACVALVLEAVGFAEGSQN